MTMSRLLTTAGSTHVFDFDLNRWEKTAKAFHEQTIFTAFDRIDALRIVAFGRDPTSDKQTFGEQRQVMRGVTR